MNPDFVLMQDRKQSITKAMAQQSRDSIKKFDALTDLAKGNNAVASKAKEELRTLFNDMRPEERVAGEYCKANEDHGLLGVHVTGLKLVCGDKRCNHQQAISVGGAK